MSVDYLGKRIVITPDDVEEEWLGKIIQVHPGENGPDAIVVELDSAFRSGLHRVKHLMLAGISMDAAEELFGIRRRPRGLPVLVFITRLRDPDILPENPMGADFLGRGQLRKEGESARPSRAQEIRDMIDEAEEFAINVASKHGMTLTFDYYGLERFSFLVDEVFAQPVVKEEEHKFLLPWGHFLSVALMRSYHGELWKDPADGWKVKFYRNGIDVVVDPIGYLRIRLREGESAKHSMTEYVSRVAETLKVSA